MRCMAVFLSLICLATAIPRSEAHPGHFSVSEIEWNPTSGRYEIAMRLRIPDLEDAISVQQKHRFRFDANPDAAIHIRSYLQKHFSVLNDGHKSCRLRWVGIEPEIHHVWIYFEAESVSEAATDGTVRDRRVTTQQATQKRAVPQNGEAADDRWAAFLKPNTGTAPQSSSDSVIRIRNTVLMDVQPEQVNVVSLKRGHNVQSASLTAKQPQTALGVR